jgi:hypothetical protein
MSASRIFSSLRDAVHSTATTGKLSMKGLAAEIDYSPSELSMRITLGGDSARPFPCDEDHLVKMMKVQEDYSILFTLADQCGFELQPKKERLAEMVMEMRRSIEQLIPRAEQILLEIPGLEGIPSNGKPKTKRRPR